MDPIKAIGRIEAAAARAASKAAGNSRALTGLFDDEMASVAGLLKSDAIYSRLPPHLQRAADRGDWQAVLRASGGMSGLGADVRRALDERMGVLVPEKLVRRQSFDLIPQQPRGMIASGPPAARMGVLVPEELVRRQSFDLIPQQPRGMIVSEPPPAWQVLGDAPEQSILPTHAASELGEIMPPVEFIPSHQRGGLSLVDPGFRGYQAQIGDMMVDQYGPGALRGALDNPGNALSVLSPGSAARSSDPAGMAALVAAAAAGLAGMGSVQSPGDLAGDVGIMEPPGAGPVPPSLVNDGEDGMLGIYAAGDGARYADPDGTAALAAETSPPPEVLADPLSPEEQAAEALVQMMLPRIGEEDVRLLRHYLESGAARDEALYRLLKQTR